MEWLILVLILALPLLRLMMLPVRLAGTVRRLPVTQIALIGGVVIVAWFVLDAVNNPRESTARYVRGDAEMRKLLE
jgi:hypothetical protein